MQSLLKKLVREVIAEVLSEEKKKRGPGRPRKKPGNPLARFLDRDPRGTEHAADALGISPEHANKLARDGALPSLETALEIDKKTSGVVSVDSWK